jgi:hypothetical protein
MSILQTADEPEVSVPLGRLRWTWLAEETPVKIHLPLDLVERLRSEIAGDQRRTTTEIGGVLLGRGTPGSIEVRDYAWVSGEGEAAAEYKMNAGGLASMREGQKDLLVIGYFRTQLDGALHLRRQEVDFVGEHFHDRSNVVMLIRPTTDRFRAGFLFWEGNAFVPFSVRDFTFEAESLRSTASIRVEIPQPKAPVATVKAPVTGPIYLPAQMTVKSPLSQPVPAGGGYVRRGLLGLAGAVTASLCVGFLLQDRLLPAERVADPPVVVASVPMELQANAEYKGLDIRWNPQSKPVVTAHAAQLAMIHPDGRDEVVPVDLLQLAQGQMHLGSFGDSIEVRLQVVDGNGRATKESFSALNLAPPVAEETPVVAKKWTPPAKPEAKAASVSTWKSWKPSPWKAASTQLAKPLTPPPTDEVLPVVLLPAIEQPKAPATDDDQAFAGRWAFSRSQGPFDVSNPEVVEGVIQEENGHLSGTMFVHFKGSPDGNPDATHKFQFAGDLQGGRSQVFPLDSVAGTQGTIELVAGNAPNVLEVRLETPSERGTIHTGNIVLVKK